MRNLQNVPHMLLSLIVYTVYSMHCRAENSINSKLKALLRDLYVAIL